MCETRRSLGDRQPPEIAERARVMLVHNIDVCDGLVNGAQGTVAHIVSQAEEVKLILVQFDSERVGQFSVPNRFCYFCDIL